MNSALILVAAVLPALAAGILAIFGNSLRYKQIVALANIAAFASFAIFLSFAFLLPDISDFHFLHAGLGAWLDTPDIQSALVLELSPVSLLFSLLVSGFGFAIIFYSIGYMNQEEGPARYFAAFSLFLSAMLVLVLAENLFLLFLGWEGVGLCSYFLIGHYWKRPEAPIAAYRAFFFNRIGDVLFLLGAFFVFKEMGNASLSKLSVMEIPPDSRANLAIAAILLLGGAFGKSAQIPLHVWLPDAMAGPTPVSALIHAATMVTAGVYMLARLDWLYSFAFEARSILLLSGLLTLWVGTLIATAKTDIKKVLAYSTLANLGLMFVALSGGSSGSALLHVFGHASFKAILFLAAGSIILSSHHEQELPALRGVLKRLPITRVAMWVGCLGAAGFFPFVSSGFLSKEAILSSFAQGKFFLFGLNVSGQFVYFSVLGAELLSLLYIFRMLGILEGKPGEIKANATQGTSHPSSDASGLHPKESSATVRISLVVFILFAIAYSVFTGLRSFGESHFLSYRIESHVNIVMGIIQILVAGGFFWIHFKNIQIPGLAKLTGPMGPLTRNFYFDDIYNFLIMKPLGHFAAFIHAIMERPVFAGVLSFAEAMSTRSSISLQRLSSGWAPAYALSILVSAGLLILLAVIL